jgi:hypothetical protein
MRALAAFTVAVRIERQLGQMSAYGRPVPGRSSWGRTLVVQRVMLTGGLRWVGAGRLAWRGIARRWPR